MLLTLNPNVLDRRTGRLTVKYEASNSISKYTAARFVAQCVLSCGLAPSYAFCSSPTASFGAGAWDSRGLKVALKNTGPAADLKLLTRAEISYEESQRNQGIAIRLMTGWLVSHSHQFGMREDSVVTQVFDDRIILDKFTVSGCLCYDPRGTGRFYWDLSRKCIFNEMGWPNCIDSPLGPVFAPTFRFGFADSFKKNNFSDDPALDTTEPVKGAAKIRARSFDCDDAIKYLRLVHSHENNGFLPPLPINMGSTRIPKYIDWPASLGMVFGATKRILKHESMQGGDGKGMGLGLALQTILRKAGAYDLYVMPQAEFKSRLTIVDLNPGNRASSQLFFPDYNPGIRNCMNASVIKEGHIIESAVDYFHDVCIQGDAPSVEMMIAMPENENILSAPSVVEDGICQGLQPAWSQQEHDQAIAYVAANQGAGPGFGNFTTALNQAFKIWPFWLAAYKVTPGFNPWKGTKWEGMMNGGAMRFKPFLNTGFQMDGSSPANWQPRGTVFENYKDEEQEINDARNPWGPDNPPVQEWQNVTTLDGLSLSADSTILILDGLRGAGQTWYEKQVTDADGNMVGTRADHIFAKPIRGTVALEGDWPITGRAGADDPNNTANRVNQEFRYCWNVPALPMDYQELLRRGDSYPVGKTKMPASITTSFPPHATKGNELFSDRIDEKTGILPDHAKTRLSDVKRVAYYANVRIPMIAPAWQPGKVIEIVGANTLPCTTVIKSVKFSMVGTTTDPKESPAVPDTWIEAGPPDMAVLQGDPAAGHATVSSSPGEYTDTPKTPDDYPGESGSFFKPGDDIDTGGKSQTQAPIDTGGRSQTTSDPYENNATGLGGRDVQRQTKVSSDETKERGPVKVTSDETRTSTPASSGSWQTPGGKYDEGGTPNAKRGAIDPNAKGAVRQQHAQDHQARATERKAGAQASKSKDTEGIGNWLGKPNSGSMTDSRGGQHTSIMGKGTPGFGESSSGSMTDARGGKHTSIMGNGTPGFGEGSSGSMTAGARGGSHREWELGNGKQTAAAAGGGNQGQAPKVSAAAGQKQTGAKVPNDKAMMQQSIDDAKKFAAPVKPSTPAKPSTKEARPKSERDWDE